MIFIEIKFENMYDGYNSVLFMSNSINRMMPINHSKMCKAIMPINTKCLLQSRYPDSQAPISQRAISQKTRHQSWRNAMRNNVMGIDSLQKQPNIAEKHGHSVI